MSKQAKIRIFLLTVCSILFVVTALAQSQREVKKKLVGPIAEVSFDRSEIQWRPHVEYESLVLTVSRPDGEVVRLEFEAGQAPYLKLSETDGAALPDGSYNYELRQTPKFDAEVKDSLRAAEAEGTRTQVERALKKSGKLPGEPLIQHGSFLIEKGKVHMGSASEGATPQRISSNLPDYSAPPREELTYFKPVKAAFRPFDQVIPDDLIVQGSICVGLDCVNNENFGFDTIRLKENNTRIKFEDTSVGTFPSTDWQLTANDSASGGQNRFSIEDITAARVPFTVEGGTTTNSLYLDSTGRVGFRTSTPVLDLHVNTSNTPGLRLEQNSSGGFSAQTWDIAGNEANFFIRDVTGGSLLPFRIRPGAPTSSIDIAADGDVGIGTASPSARVHISHNTVDTLWVESTQSSGAGNGAGIIAYSNDNAALASGDRLGFYLTGGFDGTARRNAAGITSFTEGAWSNGVFPANLIFETTQSGTRTEKMRITGAGLIGIGVANPTQNIHHSSGATLTGATWTNGSSKALKTNIRGLSARDAFATLRGLNPVTFRYKANPEESFVGFIAEDVPELVATNDRKGLSPMDIVAVLTKVLQEQQKTITELQKRVEQLEKEKAK